MKQTPTSNIVEITANKKVPQKEEPKPTIVQNPQPAQDASKSYCKCKGHDSCEIVFACYECSDTYCYKCLDAHRSHTLIFFKDAYLVSNYENVNQITKATPENSQSPSPVE